MAANIPESRALIRIKFANQGTKNSFVELAQTNRWETKIEGKTYALKTKPGGYAIQEVGDYVNGRWTGCFIPTSLNPDKVTTDDNRGTREAVSQVFQAVQTQNRLK